jgi:hypothetical protein
VTSEIPCSTDENAGVENIVIRPQDILNGFKMESGTEFEKDNILYIQNMMFLCGLCK